MIGRHIGHQGVGRSGLGEKMRFPWFLSGRFDGIEGLQPPKKEDFQRLVDALDYIATSDMIPAKKPADRLQAFLAQIDVPKGQRPKLMSIWHRGKNASAKMITETECKGFLKLMDSTGLLDYGQPLPYFAKDAYMFPLAFANRVGAPNAGLAKGGVHEVYEMYSLDVGQVLSEMGRYYLTKAAVEIKSDEKSGVVHVRMHQRSGAAPGDMVDETYYGNAFIQDDTAYIVMFKDSGLEPFFSGTLGASAADASASDTPAKGTAAKAGGKELASAKGKGNKSRQVAKKTKRVPLAPLRGKKRELPDRTLKSSGGRKNMAVMVLSGLARGEDGLHEKFTGGQIGRALMGSVNVLNAPCVLYRVSNNRVLDIARKLNAQRQGNVSDTIKRVLRANGGDLSAPVKAEIMKEFAGQEEILYGIDPEFASVMSDLGVPVPRPDGDDSAGGPQLVLYDN